MHLPKAFHSSLTTPNWNVTFEISRNTLPDYLLYLEKAGLINLLREKPMA